MWRDYERYAVMEWIKVKMLPKKKKINNLWKKSKKQKTNERENTQVSKVVAK